VPSTSQIEIEETEVELETINSERIGPDGEKIGQKQKKEKQVTVIEKDVVQKIIVAGTEDNLQAKEPEEQMLDNKHVLQNAHLDFIDNVKEIVTRKDIIPKFYDGDLSLLLMRTTIIVFLTAVVTVSKLIFEKHQ